MWQLAHGPANDDRPCSRRTGHTYSLRRCGGPGWGEWSPTLCPGEGGALRVWGPHCCPLPCGAPSPPGRSGSHSLGAAGSAPQTLRPGPQAAGFMSSGHLQGPLGFWACCRGALALSWFGN